MTGDVLVFVEHRMGQIDSITYQMLTKGHELTEELGTRLVALVTGHQVDDICAILRDKGVDEVLVLDDPALYQAGPEAQTGAIVEAVRRTDAYLLLIGYSLAGMELAPAVATRLGCVCMTNCVNVESQDGLLMITRPIFEGVVHERIALEDAGPFVVAIQKGVVPAVGLPPKDATVRHLTVDPGVVSGRSKVLEIIEEPMTGVDITKADIIVAVGRGIGDKTKLRIIEELAEALGGIIACSRPVVDLGWLPYERQVGASGRTVNPKVYIALGISGSSQHVAGMSESKLIIAVNKDPDSPIFQIAHYGVIGDLFEVVPALVEETRRANVV